MTRSEVMGPRIAHKMIPAVSVEGSLPGSAAASRPRGVTVWLEKGLREGDDFQRATQTPAQVPGKSLLTQNTSRVTRLSSSH